MLAKKVLPKSRKIKKPDKIELLPRPKKASLSSIYSKIERKKIQKMRKVAKMRNQL